MSSPHVPRFVKSHDLTYTLAPELAGRVTNMSYRGRDLLVSSAVHPDNWGATYWTSPQADWGWPPVPEVDSAPYVAEEVESGWLLKGPVATIGERRFEVHKRFVQGPHQNTIDTCYSIVNVGTLPFKMANWEIARVHPRGLTFFPTGASELTPIAPHHPLMTKKQHGMTIFDHADFEVGKSLKLHADGTGGFLAHVSAGDLILKLFRDTTPALQAPGEGECEIFANFDGKYVEIEVQGPYVAVQPGSRNDFWVRTAVTSLPRELQRGEPDSRDDEALFQFAREQASVYAAPDLVQAWSPSD